MEPQTVTPVTTVAPDATRNYASFGRRLGAVLLDGLILGVVGVIVSLPFTIVATVMNTAGDPSTVGVFGSMIGMIGSILNIVISFGYAIYFIGKDGQTLGKKALGIKVIRLNGEPKVGYTNAFLRESVGKFISSLILGIGYLMMLGDQNKQTLHDKISGTVVIKV
ncbi:RDD family protein [Candidatus Microgenomates bacterium]|nr:RDD family protein [Candidatus Microgenomates bacterium]